MLSITFPNGLYQSISSASSSQNSSGSSWTPHCIRARPVDAVASCENGGLLAGLFHSANSVFVLPSATNSIDFKNKSSPALYSSELRSELLVASPFWRATLWSQPPLFWKRQQPTTSRETRWHVGVTVTSSEAQGVKRDSFHVHHFKLVCQTLLQCFFPAGFTITMTAIFLKKKNCQEEDLELSVFRC